jgi:hypothetical protein
MIKFKIIRDVEMRKLFEQPPESASLFLEVPELWKQQTRKRFTASLECRSSEKYVKSKYRIWLTHELLKSILITGTTNFNQM